MTASSKIMTARTHAREGAMATCCVCGCRMPVDLANLHDLESHALYCERCAPVSGPRPWHRRRQGSAPFTLPAPETSHAICGAVREAIRCRETNEEKCILFNLSGHGLCDLGSYDRFLGGELEDYVYPQEKIEEALAELPVLA